jgi:hypothetical protein
LKLGPPKESRLRSSRASVARQGLPTWQSEPRWTWLMTKFRLCHFATASIETHCATIATPAQALPIACVLTAGTNQQFSHFKNSERTNRLAT